MTLTDTLATLAGRRGTLAVHRWRPAGPPTAAILLLHGLGEHGGQYAPLGAAAVAAGVEVWAPDQAGHGRSDGERVLVTAVDDLVADAETVLHALRATRPGVPVVVVGHSLGATVATLLAGEIRPGDDPAAEIAGLVLAGAALTGATGLDRLLASGIDPMSLSKDPGELVRDPEQAQRVREDPLVWDGGLRPETLRALAGASARTARLVTIGALDHLPVLFLHGAEDDLASPDQVVALAVTLPRARAVVYPHDRHNVLHDLDRAAVHGELLRFVAGVTGS